MICRNRYIRSEKGKWVPCSSRESRRSPIRIPDCDSSSLIEDNRLTLIGKVTNPAVQPPKAVIGFLPQLWNMENRARGHELGTDCFQFRFKNEEDMLAILDKAPFTNLLLVQSSWYPVTLLD